MSEERCVPIASIKESMKSGDKFKTVGVLASARLKRDKNNQPYWDLTIVDASGTLYARAWSDSKWWDIRDGEKKALTQNDLEGLSSVSRQPVGVFGVVTKYKQRLQYHINQIYLLDSDKYPPESFIEKSPVPLEQMEADFWAIVNECGDPLRTFLHTLFSEDLWEQFKIAPAAVKNHHAYVHGLLEHTLDVTKSARAIGFIYLNKGLNVDMDVLTAGALLHDIGKLGAYSIDLAPQITLYGAVIDHIPLGYSMFMDFARKYDLDENITLAIGHIIVSHHGKKEYGSPVLPSTPEALIVSAADELDFLIYCWDSAYPADELSLSEYNGPAQRRFWKT